MRRLVMVVLLAFVLVPFASAERNWKATLAVSPAPSVGQANTVSGCGYVPSTFLKVYVVWDPNFGNDWVGYDFNTASDASGCFSASWTPTSAGLYGIWAYQPNKPGTVLQAKSHIEFSINPN